MNRIGLGSLIMTSVILCACASDPVMETADNETSTPQVPSVIFLQYLNQQAPILICNQDPQVACLNMPTSLCQASVQASAERCGPELLKAWPASFAENQANATRYAQEYRNCLLQDWVDEYGLQTARLEACGIQLPPSSESTP
ncbi:hypothetical protein [Reinekea blandensis]|uniref:Orphan protein n=1 Tax=Reinekea blandensis MED297 TaxID=314283 RepID=A4BD41_9GAMM|nr:hypothetical protein [Reinekea blandensis]EAR09785.1 hypothetical protein MED297_05534 [Reinekea sp. MED297] [Reinekea blandensis MED297]